MAVYKKIILGLQFSDPGRSALDAALALARDQGATIIAFHALDYHLTGLPHDDPRLAKARGSAQKRLETEVLPLTAECPEFTPDIRPADPAMGILRLARDEKADLIILGSHLGRAAHFSSGVDLVAVTIMDMAPCPVLLVPENKS